MRLNTASEVISFAKSLENESSKLYTELSNKYEKDKDVFLSFVKENNRNVTDIERTYYGVISDAIEGCFAFSIETDNYTIDNKLAGELSRSEILKWALEIEEKIARFYTDGAEQSKSLMADVPKIFRIVAKKRSSRILKLGEL